MIQLHPEYIRNGFNEEQINGFTVSTLRKQLWSVLIEISLEIDRICKKHNIKYTIEAGSAIGMIRHQGFIPWDDDIDFTLIREEFDKLMAVLPNELDTSRFFLQTINTDNCSIPYAKIRRNNTYQINEKIYLDYKENNTKLNFNHCGMFVDIFVLDYTANNFVQRKQHLSGILKQKGILENVQKKIRQAFYNNDQELYTQLKQNQKNWYKNKYLKICQKYNNNETCKNWVIYSTIPHIRNGNSFLYSKFFDNFVRLQFENVEFDIVQDYEDYLDMIYDNWQVPVHEPTNHGLQYVGFDLNNLQPLYNI